MEDRLAELKRQRALVAEHLQWIDQEIRRSGGAPTAPPPPVAASTPAQPSLPSVGAGPAAKPAADVLPNAPELPALDPQNIRQDMKRGCLLWATIAFLLVVLFFGLMAWYGRAHRPAPKPPVEGSTRVAPEGDATTRLVPGSPHRLG